MAARLLLWVALICALSTYHVKSVSCEDWYSACAVSSTTANSSPSTLTFSPSALSFSVSAFSFLLKPGRQNDCAAWASYDESMFATTGWAYLNIQTNMERSDDLQAAAAGFLEGRLTAHRIIQWTITANYSVFTTSSSAPVNMSLVYDWIHRNNDYTATQIVAHLSQPPSSTTDVSIFKFWRQSWLMECQFAGLAAGFFSSEQFLTSSTSAYPQISSMHVDDLRMLSLNGDLGDILAILYPWSLTPSNSSSSLSSSPSSRPLLDNHCSALIRLTPNASSLFVAHATWYSFPTMLRITKQYNFYFTGNTRNCSSSCTDSDDSNGNSNLYVIPAAAVENFQILFTSYPGVLYSTDDFYVVRENYLSVVETTNSVYNWSYYLRIPYATGVVAWHRTMIANRLAQTAAEWGQYFSLFNSGTYNNQWMVVDHKRFHTGAPPQNGTLFVVSQMPGGMHVKDVTDVLIQQGYWSSFNVPYFEDFFVDAGYAFKASQLPDGDYYYGYLGNFRQLLFAREAPNVTNMTDMKRVMRLNKYKTDPLSHNNSQYAIASRFDLSNPGPDGSPRSPFGAIDAKIVEHVDVDAGGASAIRVAAICGPTYDNVPPFSFADWPGVPHLGVPTLVLFPWIEFTWLSSNPEPSDSSSLAAGVIVGICVGCVCGIALLAWCCRRYYVRNQQGKLLERTTLLGRQTDGAPQANGAYVSYL